MAWQPGQRIATEQDEAEWLAWRTERKREQQRHRRATNRRIDYYPDNHAADVIDAHTAPRAGFDYSSVINRIVAEWAEHERRKTARQRLAPEQRTAR